MGLIVLPVVEPRNRLAMLAEYEGACGKAELEMAHGFWPPPHLVAGSTLFRFSLPDTHESVGWGASTPEQTENAVWLSYGVYPRMRRQGYRKQITEWLCQHAIEWHDVSLAKIGVFDRNVKHLHRMQDEITITGWREAGRVWYPEPTYTVFAKVLKP